ncbi:hypothetical protein [Rhodococcus qingshengii]|uniref:hypothetical protein n=1 Tax=Rhodococcus qingshengii TaxID=334542 RepID=UPI001E506D60|nr:hypothetical protein [Rhodococcus qingshengii]UDF21581.1 hypothetical protein LE551_01475 [Rhodococcus qingshengii]
MDWAFSDKVVAPCVVGFMILLPDPIPIPQKATWFTLTDESAPELRGTAQTPEAGLDPIHLDDEGRNFVSLRFWQMRDDSPIPFSHENELLMKAFAAMHPRDHNDLHPDDPSLGDETADDLELIQRYRTVVEAVTFYSAEPTEVTPIDRCLKALLQFHRAYRMMADQPLSTLTVKHLFPLTLVFTRNLGDTTVTPLGLSTLNGSPPNLGSLVSEIQREVFDQVAALQKRLDQYDPLARFLESRTDAAYELHGPGSYRNAIIHLGIACEVLFDGLLGMLMWEEGTSIEHAAAVFSTPITTRIKNQFHTRLKGTWKLDRGELGAWSVEVAGVRNRVVHAGYLPTAQEALAAEAAADHLRDFVARKLANAGSQYPYTGLTFFGEGEVPHGIPILNKSARKWVEENRVDLATKGDQHRKWREAVNDAIARRG